MINKDYLRIFTRFLKEYNIYGIYMNTLRQRYDRYVKDVKTFNSDFNISNEIVSYNEYTSKIRDESFNEMLITDVCGYYTKYYRKKDGFSEIGYLSWRTEGIHFSDILEVDWRIVNQLWLTEVIGNKRFDKKIRYNAKKRYDMLYGKKDFII